MDELEFLEKTGTLEIVMERMESAADADFVEL